MRLIYSFLILTLFSVSVAAQQKTIDDKFNHKLSRMLSESVPFISVEELDKIKEDVLILDAREIEEYQVSHIKNAIYIGFNNFDPSVMADIAKDKDIIIYCSIGYRSEKIGEKLQEMGYHSVRNLYGSIFEWANQGKPIVNNKNKATSQVHCYNKKWSKWMTNPEYEKVY